MFTGFNLEINNYDFLCDDSNYTTSSKFYEESKINVCSNLNQIIKDNKIDGNTLQNMCFPTEIFGDENFVFISHSHNDEELAKKFAGYLYKNFGILSFIDSCVWGYMDELNKKLNNCSEIEFGYCHNCQCDTFSYNLSCVHIMLASALITMIYKCECIFFLNTPSSINLNYKTESPWIYYELNIASTIQKISKVEKSTMESGKIEFTPNLERMIKINEKILREWEKRYNQLCDNPFAVLYKICGGDD